MSQNDPKRSSSSPGCASAMRPLRSFSRLGRRPRSGHAPSLRAKVAVSNCHLKKASLRETRIGLDIAKHVFQAHGADAAGQVL